MFFGIHPAINLQSLNRSFSKGAARWTSIFVASSLFAFAHDGSGFSANPGSSQRTLPRYGISSAKGDFNLTEARFTLGGIL